MDDDIAPPAYSEQEFDQKLSAAVQVSLTISQPESADWEQWDEAIFEAEAAKRRMGTGEASSSASSSSVGFSSQHLAFSRIGEKRSLEKSGSSGLTTPDAGPSSPPASTASSSSSSRSTAAEPTRFIVHNVPDDDHDDHSIPPPPFTPVGPSLDGPPFEEVEAITLTFTGELEDPTIISVSLEERQPSPPSSPPQSYTSVASSPASPAPPQLSLPDSPPRPLSSLSIPSPNDAPNRRSLPPTMQLVVEPLRITPRPATMSFSASASKPAVSQPRVEFRPSNAYIIPGINQNRQNQPPVVDASAFYNSAVSQHLRPTIPTYSTARPAVQVQQPLAAYYMPPVSPRPRYPPAPPPTVNSSYNIYNNQHYQWQAHP